MCGICGIAGAADVLVGRESLIDRARDTLIHRGPDDAGTWRARDGRVALAMRRLAIVDLTECGHQPMHRQAGDDELTLVFNGEIYNHAELRDQLAGLGHSFRGHSDTEVILAAYLQWGTQCLGHFVGMFAFALHDPRSRQLFLARDRAGEKPLFYSHTGGRFTFGSELSALMEDDRFERRLDVDALNNYLAFGYTPSDRTMLQGVRKLPPGHALTYDIDRDVVRFWPFWRLPERGAPAKGSAEELSRELEHLLQESVRKQMQADVPVSIMLSGGIDSSLVTAMAVRTVQNVRTFTITMPTGGYFNEGPAARRIADFLGTNHTELEAEPASVELLPQLSRRLSEPIADSSVIPTYLLSNLITKHAKVALGGDGGDELFGGYAHHAWVVQHELLRKIGRGPGRLAAKLGVKMLPLGFRGRNYLTALSTDFDVASGKIGQYFDVDWRTRISPLVRTLGDDALHAPEVQKSLLGLSMTTPVQKATAIDFLTYMTDDVLAKVDRASMLTSLEVRAPWLDHRIVEFAFSRVPDHLRTTLSRGKILPRMLASRLLPPEIVALKKQGFSIPLHAWFKGEWGSYMESVIREAPRELLDPVAVDELVKLQRRGLSNTHRIFTLTVLELWRREYGIGLPA